MRTLITTILIFLITLPVNAKPWDHRSEKTLHRARKIARIDPKHCKPFVDYLKVYKAQNKAIKYKCHWWNMRDVTYKKLFETDDSYLDLLHVSCYTDPSSDSAIGTIDSNYVPNLTSRNLPRRLP